MNPSSSFPSPSGLYARIAEAFENSIESSDQQIRVSGFVDPSVDQSRGSWRPHGEFPENIFGGKADTRSVRVCLFGAHIYVALHGRAFTEFERGRLANTVQPLTLILNGRETIQASFCSDGRSGWSCFRTEIPIQLAHETVRSIEIDHDGKLLFSRFLGQSSDTKDYRATVWAVNSSGKLSGGVTGAGCDVPIEIGVGDRVSWTITVPPLEPGRPRRFEFDLRPACKEGSLIDVSVRNPETGTEAACSPIGVFASQGEHFLIANPSISDGRCSAVLVSVSENRRRSLSIGDVTRPTMELVCRADREDSASARFDGAHNTFDLDIARLQAGGLVILDEAEKIIGELPTFDQIADLADSIFK
jgi:hypothetical protein